MVAYVRSAFGPTWAAKLVWHSRPRLCFCNSLLFPQGLKPNLFLLFTQDCVLGYLLCVRGQDARATAGEDAGATQSWRLRLSSAEITTNSHHPTAQRKLKAYGHGNYASCECAGECFLR